MTHFTIYDYDHPASSNGIRAVDQHGVDWDGQCTLHHLTDRYMVFKSPAGSHWAGRGERANHKSQLHIVKIETRKDYSDDVDMYNFIRITGVEILSMPVRTPKSE